ncbi:MAG TPA: NAD(P)/FAD-dependent oxidoreductase, partial [Anaeromyxobacter sp.]|nr:NAD(P)/FAD-dependent oxidoreductase [Anaeromyxobacter sp.]
QPLPFHYWDKGLVATIGRAAAVADLGRVRVSGLLAWLLWLLVHVFFLIGFRNRVAVILQWAWSYLTWKRGARLITETAEQWRFIAERRSRDGATDRAPGAPAQGPPPAPPGEEPERATSPTVH